jgi:hypothetical protein
MNIGLQGSASAVAHGVNGRVAKTSSSCGKYPVRTIKALRFRMPGANLEPRPGSINQ